ncbi:HTH_48 domain-containing protein [Trichonephila clavipes]|nr:HTH_48 domain-containing protein [Trichonephila clavipes]
MIRCLDHWATAALRNVSDNGKMRKGEKGNRNDVNIYWVGGKVLSYFKLAVHYLLVTFKVKNMSVDKVHFRHCILYEFQKGSNTSVACKNLCAVFGKDIVNVRTCQRWFSKFRSGKLSLQESDRSGRPPKIDNDVL